MKTLLTWKCRATGYYESISIAGTALLIQGQGRGWRLYAGDRTEPRGIYVTLTDAKIAADRMFS